VGDYADCVWRVGSKHGRTIWAVLGDGEREDGTVGNCDVFLGLMETKDIAQDVVDAHNDNLDPPMHVRQAIAADYAESAE